MADALYIKIGGLEESEGGWVRCPSGKVLEWELFEYGFLQGKLGPCPDNAQTCARYNCPNACSGNGKCVNEKCECYDGYSGRDCTLTKCYDDEDCGAGVCDKKTGICLAPPPPPFKVKKEKNDMHCVGNIGKVLKINIRIA